MLQNGSVMPFWAKVEVFLLDSEAQDSKIEGYTHLKKSVWQMVFQKDKSTKIPPIRVSVHPFPTIPPQCILSNLKIFPDLNGGNVIFLFQFVFPRKVQHFPRLLTI